jgi:hypothetical protein
MLTTRSVLHFSLGKEGVPTTTRFMLCALILQKDQVHSRSPYTEAYGPHKQTRSQSD